jgi:hypothetical protein
VGEGRADRDLDPRNRGEHGALGRWAVEGKAVTSRRHARWMQFCSRIYDGGAQIASTGTPATGPSSLEYAQIGRD